VNLPAAGSVFAFMSRTAPLMTLVAVGVLGGGLFAVNTMKAHDPTTAAPANTAQSAAVAPATPPAGAPQDGAPPAGHEVDLAGVPVAGAKDAAAPPAAAPKAGDAKADPKADAGTADDLFAGASRDGDVTVAIGVNENKAAAVVGANGKANALSGSATARGLDLVDRTGKVVLNGTMDDNVFTGTITLNGKKINYTADGTTAAEAKADGRTDVADVAKKVGL
jgi:hypothetical protein